MSTRSEFPRVFISYRHDDSSEWTKHLFDELAAHFGPEKLFLDVENILPGVDFATSILQALHYCDVLLVVIGPKWVDLVDETGRRRIDDPLDYVRMEIEESFSGVVIPVLVGGASMPKEEELPVEIRRLRRWQGMELRVDSFEDDAKRLINRMDELLREAKARKERQPQASGLPIRDYFEVILPTILRWKSPLAAKLAAEENCTLQFNVLGEEDGGTWTLMLKGSAPKIHSGSVDKPDLTITLTEGAMHDILAGRFDARSAIAEGQIELSGDPKLLKTAGVLFGG